MSEVVIKVENVSKQYRLGAVGTGTLSHDLNRMWARVRGKEDPFAKIGDTNDRTVKASSDFVWSLKDINFEVRHGEVLGIIGRNGAGKSTLLKILSRTTSPTTGKIKIKGRVASLLEVGTGFHPELTGKENIYLNGAILGMNKAEINRKFDEIVDFSGVERYIDTPVKRYSSGMYVRLAFAVAANLEPDILIVDEVLAVGDAEFQKKCIGKMKDVSVKEGRTVLFVSHNMVAVKSLCDSGVVLDNGRLVYTGTVRGAINLYNSNFSNVESSIRWPVEEAPGNDKAKITAINFETEDDFFCIENEIQMEIEFINLSDNHLLNVSVSIFDENEVYVLATPNPTRVPLSKGVYKSTCTIPKDFLNTGKYFFTVLLVGNNFEIITQLDKVVVLEIQEKGTNRNNFFGKWGGVVRPYFKWGNSLIN